MGCISSKKHRPEMSIPVKEDFDKYLGIMEQAIIETLKSPRKRRGVVTNVFRDLKVEQDNTLVKVNFLEDGKESFIIGREHCGVPAEFILLMKKGEYGTIQYGEGRRYATSSYNHENASLYVWKCVKCNVQFSSQI